MSIQLDNNLASLEHLPKYQEHSALSYFDQSEQAHRVAALKAEFSSVVEIWHRMKELDRSDMVAYSRFAVDVPGSLLGAKKSIALPRKKYANTVVSVGDRVVERGVLLVDAGWRTRSIHVTYSSPSRDCYASELRSLRERLEQITPAERRALQEIVESRFAHPVLFISHRWESVERPDPHAAQLARLRELKKCFIIYDYSSFRSRRSRRRGQRTSVQSFRA